MAFINLLDVVYPIGTILETSSNVSPASTIGGTWIKQMPVFTDIVELTSVKIVSDLHSNGNTIYFYQKGNLVFGSGWISMYNFDNTRGSTPVKILQGLPKPLNIDNPITAFMFVENTMVNLGFNSSDSTILETKPGNNGTNWPNEYNLQMYVAYLTQSLPPTQTTYAWRRTA